MIRYNRTYIYIVTSYMNLYLVIYLPKVPYIHHTYVALANPKFTSI
jgi:hypothetical protein